MKSNSRYYAVFYVILAVMLLALGWIKQEPVYLWASIIIALVSFYWIWKALKKKV
jgi:hypothetical protein